ncbi:hypothetical protein JK636_20460 [Clostridium sp. YIM B02515]|uniref:Uncharacterized protein n=1 Tax=Clostridium rhizosphaerae TaxID=2803861 RepID=A0ABS1TIB5_9CLOT|nr:hypothetical protein [Clostridium rhizosphaerae]MBL4938089.1 hypothetical protein [Clostridium rhizosphaerae]
MPDNDNLVPEMRASLDRMTEKMSGESKDDLAKDYEYAVKSNKNVSKQNEKEKQAVDAYRKNL